MAKAYFSKKTAKSVKKFGRNVYKATGLVNPMKKGQLSSSRVMKDIAMLKRSLNVEKKTYDIPMENTSFLVAQVYAQDTPTNWVSGHYIQDITPIPAQGITAETRNGDSIKLTSMFGRIQFYQQSAALTKIKGVVEIVQVVGLPINNSTTMLQNYLAPNDFIQAQASKSIYDLNSARDIDGFKNFRVLRRIPFSVSGDNTASETTVVNKTIALKLNHHVKYDKNTTTVSNGQIYMIVRVDNGNSGNTAITGNPLSVPITNAFSGLRFSYYLKQYFVDN